MYDWKLSRELYFVIIFFDNGQLSTFSWADQRRVSAILSSRWALHDVRTCSVQTIPLLWDIVAHQAEDALTGELRCGNNVTSSRNSPEVKNHLARWVPQFEGINNSDPINNGETFIKRSFTADVKGRLRRCSPPVIQRFTVFRPAERQFIVNARLLDDRIVKCDGRKSLLLPVFLVFLPHPFCQSQTLLASSSWCGEVNPLIFCLLWVRKYSQNLANMTDAPKFSVKNLNENKQFNNNVDFLNFNHSFAIILKTVLFQPFLRNGFSNFQERERTERTVPFRSE